MSDEVWRRLHHDCRLRLFELLERPFTAKKRVRW